MSALGDAVERGPADEIAKALRDMIRHGSRVMPRSQQKALGPSEVGHPCPRKLAYGLMDEPGEPGFSDPLPSLIGTAFHSWLEWAAPQHNELLGRERWLPETKVTVREGLSGTCDLFDTDTGTVIDHKGLSRDTRIPTPSGWATIASLRVGDSLFAADGSVCHVTAKSPVFQRPCYRITFDDNASVVSDNVHEWNMIVGQDDRLETMSTEQAAKHVWGGQKRRQRQLRIANGGALQLDPKDLGVHPYILGAWLGDGSSNSGLIHKPDDDLFVNIESFGYSVGASDARRGITRRIHGLTKQLRSLGVVDNKHIPEEYLRASGQQRLWLLQGLMDTDGSWNRVRNNAVFSTVRPELAYQVSELIASLGCKARVWPQVAHGFGLEVMVYQVTFVPVGFNPFLLPRKAELVRDKLIPKRSTRRVIKSIESTLSVPTQCITVDSSDSTFLCGSEMIPTHNCVGKSSYDTYTRHGPSSTYRAQVHLYGAGYRNLGFDVKNVAIHFIPRTTAQLHKTYVWSEPYNQTLVDSVLARLDAVTLLIEAFDVERNPNGYMNIPIMPETCRFCRWWDPDADGSNPLRCSGKASPEPSGDNGRK